MGPKLFDFTVNEKESLLFKGRNMRLLSQYRAIEWNCADSGIRQQITTEAKELGLDSEEAAYMCNPNYSMIIFLTYLDVSLHNINDIVSGEKVLPKMFAAVVYNHDDASDFKII